MMYLSRIELDTTRRNTLIALASPQKIHGAVESSFSAERKRQLWRLDKISGRTYLLICSQDKPDLTGLFNQFGAPDTEPEWETRRYDGLLNKIADNTEWRFRITANPTHALKSKNEARGVISACKTTDEQEKWLIRKSQANGFRLERENFGVTHNMWYKFAKFGNKAAPVIIRAVTYEGVLTVTDAELFRNALVCGIGREKAYGMGMLTVMSL